MKQNKFKRMKHSFDFRYRNDSKNIVYHAERRLDGKYKVTWTYENEKDTQLYKIHIVEELIDKGLWIVAN